MRTLRLLPFYLQTALRSPSEVEEEWTVGLGFGGWEEGLIGRLSDGGLFEG